MSGLIKAVTDYFAKKEYAILKEGQELLSFQTLISFDSTSESTVTSYPVEQGSFSSANKAVSPRLYSVELCLQGTDLEIMQAIEVLDNEVDKASFIQVLTPIEMTPNCSVTKMNYVHKEYRGMLTVFLQMEEIKEVSPEYTQTNAISSKNAKNKSDVSTENGGQVQGKKPRKSVLTQLGL